MSTSSVYSDPTDNRLSLQAALSQECLTSIGDPSSLPTVKEKWDRYARYLAEVLHDGQNLSDYLLENEAATKARLWK